MNYDELTEREEEYQRLRRKQSALRSEFLDLAVMIAANGFDTKCNNDSLKKKFSKLSKDLLKMNDKIRGYL
jgi:hypothetical protein